MSGKGQKRREKNFRAAHPGYTPLPLPPSRSDLEAVPSKLRQLIQLKNQTERAASATSKDKGRLRKSIGCGITHQRIAGKSQLHRHTTSENESISVARMLDEGKKDLVSDIDMPGKKKKKCRRVTFDYLKVQNMSQGEVAPSSQRRERRKQYLKNKRNKHKNQKKDEVIDFPGREKIQFGDVVEAPPKLKIPKVCRNSRDASNERLRLQAVEVYRKIKGWWSRPGALILSPGTQMC